MYSWSLFFFFQAEDGIRDKLVTGVQTCALPISRVAAAVGLRGRWDDTRPGDFPARRGRAGVFPGCGQGERGSDRTWALSEREPRAELRRNGVREGRDLRLSHRMGRRRKSSRRPDHHRGNRPRGAPARGCRDSGATPIVTGPGLTQAALALLDEVRADPV